MFVNGNSLVRTRFAPSPTGYLHIGGVRTALFNYMHARRYDGSFILRIDDTDTSRNNNLTVKPILDGLKWLGIDWDEGPIRQSERKQHYIDVAVALIRMGLAYPEPPRAEKDGTPYRGNNRNMNPSAACSLYDDTGWAIRFRVPEGQRIVLDDLVRRQVTWDSDLIGDPIIIRSTGDATYNFATVVDDGEMKITHVIRGEEHLSNTPIQLLLLDALGHTPPFYAHVPYVCEPNSNRKLSKRDSVKFITEDVISQLKQIGFSKAEIESREELNPVSLSFYEAVGYKPAAVVNYLARLGWSLDDKTEIISPSKLEKAFDVKKVKTGPARFDPVKMLWVNAEYVKEDSIDVKTMECLRFLGNANLIDILNVKPADLEKTQKVIACCGDRIKKYSDILRYGTFFYAKPKYDPVDFEKYFSGYMAKLVDVLVQLFKSQDNWYAKDLNEQVVKFMELRYLKPSPMIFAIRVALCGNNVGPSLFESMEILGKTECIERLCVAIVHRYNLDMADRNG